MTGWIKLHRDIREHWIWQNATYYKAWSDMLMEAYHQTKSRLYNGNLVVIERGQIVGSLQSYGNRWEMTVSQVRHFLDLLEQDKMISKQTAQGFTHLTICNYDTYQNVQQADSTQTASSPQAHRKLTATPKELKNVKNERNIYSKQQQLDDIKNSLDDYKLKFPTKDVVGQFEFFCDYLDSKDKRYKNYSAGFKNWLRRSQDVITKKNNDIKVSCPNGHATKIIEKGIYTVCPECFEQMIPMESMNLKKMI